MKAYWKDIKEKTSGMSRAEACSYILTYYWYHILGFVSILALILLFAAHYAFGNKKPVFTCVIVNQEINASRDNELTAAFAKEAGLPSERIVIDSNYNFSYGEVRLEGTNESSYEKFFFQWQNKELDAVILPESFYWHCKEMGGRFEVLEEDEVEGLAVYEDAGERTAVILGTDRFMEKVSGKKDEKLLLAFPSSGKNRAESKRFLAYLRNINEEQAGGKGIEEIIH